ncbi:MAG: proton-conducting transporter membrane subunit [Thermoproteus sp.]
MAVEVGMDGALLVGYAALGYFAARTAIGARRAAVAIDIAYLAALAYLLLGASPLALLAVPYYLGLFMVGSGRFKYYSGLASALSATGVVLMAEQALYVKALGFLMAVLAPAALLPTELDRGSLEGIFRYLVVSSIASSMVLAGLGTRGYGPFGEALLFLGIGLELGLAPMFLWVPDVYGRSSPAGLAALSSLPVLAGGFALLFLKPSVEPIVAYALGGASMLIGNLGALTSGDLRRILAYSTVVHGGFAAFLYPLRPEASLAILLADSIGKMGLFYAMASGAPRWGVVVLAAHQIGLPPLFGFWPKILLVLTSAELLGPAAGLYVLANVVLAAPYYFRLMMSIRPGRAAFPQAVAILSIALGLAAPLWLFSGFLAL